MHTRIVAQCSCGKRWEDDETPERAYWWWRALAIVDPTLVREAMKAKKPHTVEYAFQLSWARHSLFREQVHNEKHTLRVIERVFLGEADMALPSLQKKNKKGKSGETSLSVTTKGPGGSKPAPHKAS